MIRLRCPRCRLEATVSEPVGSELCAGCGVRLRWNRPTPPPGSTPPRTEIVKTAGPAVSGATEADGSTSDVSSPRYVSTAPSPEARAVRLRRLWFTDIVPALEHRFPGATEQLLFAEARLTSATELWVRCPASYPLLPPVQPEVRRGVRDIVSEVDDEVRVKVTFSERAGRVRARVAPTSTDVVAPGDPHPSAWPRLTEQVQVVVVGSEAGVLDVVTACRPVAFSRFGVWFACPSIDARRARRDDPPGCERSARSGRGMGARGQAIPLRGAGHAIVALRHQAW